VHLSGGECHDAPEGENSITAVGTAYENTPILMDKAYESDKVRELAEKNMHPPVVPPKSNRKNPWEYDKTLYKQRNVIERFFRRIKASRRTFTRYDNLDLLFLAFIYLACIVIWLN
jgi:transposase